MILLMMRLFSIFAEGRDMISGVPQGFLPDSIRQVSNDYTS